MKAMRSKSRSMPGDHQVDAESYARAILNILDDYGEERGRFNDTQLAVLNILEDAAAEKARLSASQTAVLNILEDVAKEKERLKGMQQAVLNILEDFNLERAQLAETQRATINILEDLRMEKETLEETRRSLEEEIAERARMERELMKRTEQLEAANKDLEASSQSIQRADQRFRATVESAPAAMIIVDSQGKLLLVNAYTEKLFGYHRDELVGQSAEMLVPPRLRPPYFLMREDSLTAIESPQTGTGRQFYGLRKGGAEFPLEVRLSPMQIEEGSFVLAAITDITERLAAQEQQIEAVRREVLLKEIHHRVKNNLAVISSLFYLQATYTSDELTRRVLQESQDRVRSMALVHEKLYRSENFANIDFADYAKDLAQQLVQTYGVPGKHIQLHTDFEPISLNLDLAVPCGLILNELISNSLKHAFPGYEAGEINVSLHTAGAGFCVLVVRDNGLGIPPDFDPEGARSLGVRLIRSLTRQIDAQFRLKRGNPGTEASLVLEIR
jgi:PAS domain S-box-containing protein